MEEALRLNQPLAAAYHLEEELRELWSQQDKAELPSKPRESRLASGFRPERSSTEGGSEEAAAECRMAGCALDSAAIARRFRVKAVNGYPGSIERHRRGPDRSRRRGRGRRTERG